MARVSFGQIGCIKQIALVDLRILECELVEENLLTALPSLFVEADLKSDADAADDDVVAGLNFSLSDNFTLTMSAHVPTIFLMRGHGLPPESLFVKLLMALFWHSSNSRFTLTYTSVEHVMCSWLRRGPVSAGQGQNATRAGMTATAILTAWSIITSSLL